MTDCPIHARWPLSDAERAFWAYVDEAWAEHQRGEGAVYTDAGALIADLGLEPPGSMPGATD